jgi:hypothetical protein
MLTVTVRQPDWQKAIQDIAQEQMPTIRTVLDEVGKEVIAYLQSYVSGSSGPARGGFGAKHPGGWKDITGTLAKSYKYTVGGTEQGGVLVLENTDWKAQILQARHGFFVLPSGKSGSSSMRCAMQPRRWLRPGRSTLSEPREMNALFPHGHSPNDAGPLARCSGMAQDARAGRGPQRDRTGSMCAGT